MTKDEAQEVWEAASLGEADGDCDFEHWWKSRSTPTVKMLFGYYNFRSTNAANSIDSSYYCEFSDRSLITTLEYKGLELFNLEYLIRIRIEALGRRLIKKGEEYVRTANQDNICIVPNRSYG